MESKQEETRTVYPVTKFLIMKETKCLHTKLTLEIYEAFATYERTRIICANCGVPLKSIEKSQYQITLFKVLLQAIGIAVIVFYISFKIVNYILKLIIE